MLISTRPIIFKPVIVGMQLAVLLLLFYPTWSLGEEVKPVIRIQTSPSEYLIKAEMTVPRSPHDIYRIFTDYESIDENISLFKVSRIIQRKGNTVYLYQVHIFNILFWSRETESELEIIETPVQQFNFREINGSFKTHHGSWKLIPENGGRSTVVKYDSQVIPNFYVPRWLVIYFMKRDVRKSLEELYQWVINETKQQQVTFREPVEKMVARKQPE